MGLTEELKSLGANVEEGLDRVMGDSSLYEMMLGMYVSAVAENPVSASDFDGSDLDELIKRIHMLKGVTGNLALTPLFEGYTDVLVDLRAEKAAEAKQKFEQIVPVQGKILDCIKRHAG